MLKESYCVCMCIFPHSNTNTDINTTKQDNASPQPTLSSHLLVPLNPLFHHPSHSPIRRRFAPLLQIKSRPRQQAPLLPKRAFRLLRVARSQMRTRQSCSLRSPKLLTQRHIPFKYPNSPRPAPSHEPP